ncbi:MAG: YkvA family protein [Rhodospirillales bacterium]
MPKPPVPPEREKQDDPLGDETHWKARLVRHRFWGKARRTLGKIPFSEDALAAYYCAIDPATPRHVRFVLIGALAYFILPLDKIPDFIPGLGFADDAAVLAAAIRSISGYLHADHYAQARAFLVTEDPGKAPKA